MLMSILLFGWFHLTKTSRRISVWASLSFRDWVKSSRENAFICSVSLLPGYSMIKSMLSAVFQKLSTSEINCAFYGFWCANFKCKTSWLATIFISCLFTCYTILIWLWSLYIIIFHLYSLRNNLKIRKRSREDFIWKIILDYTPGFFHSSQKNSMTSVLAC